MNARNLKASRLHGLSSSCAVFLDFSQVSISNAAKTKGKKKKMFEIQIPYSLDMLDTC
jgi:hypothetical protein